MHTNRTLNGMIAGAMLTVGVAIGWPGACLR